MGFTSLISPSLTLFPLRSPTQVPNPTTMASFSIITTRRHQQQQQKPFLLSFNHLPSPTKPFSSFSLKTPFESLSVGPRSRSFNSGPISPDSHSTKPLSVLLSLLKTPLYIAITAAAALFLYHIPSKPMIALAKGVAAAPEVDTLAGKESAAAEEEELEEREKILEEYLQENPCDVKALKVLMEVKVRKQKLEEAIDVVGRLMEVEPFELEWPLLRARLFGYNGETEMARKGFEEVLVREPLRIEAFHWLIMAAGQMDSEWESGDEELRKVMKRIEEAMERCRKEKRKDELRDFKLLVAQVRVIEGNYAEGLKVYQELVKEEPRDFRPYLYQGIIYTLLGKKDEAQRNFEKYRRLMPTGHPYARYFDDNMLATKVAALAAAQKRAES